MVSACVSLSITHGPAMKTSGAPPPIRSPGTISTAPLIGIGPEQDPSLALAGAPVLGALVDRARDLRDRRVLDGLLAEPAQAVLVGGADEVPEERMGIERARLELRMKLAGEEPGMVLDLDD